MRERPINDVASIMNAKHFDLANSCLINHTRHTFVLETTMLLLSLLLLFMTGLGLYRTLNAAVL